MILFFRTPNQNVIATEVKQTLSAEDIQKLCWLYGEATVEKEENLSEDEVKNVQNEIQKITDKYTKMIDTISQEKEQEVLKV